MNKLNLHRIRNEINTLFYMTFYSLSTDQRKVFTNALEAIDMQIKDMEEF